MQIIQSAAAISRDKFALLCLDTEPEDDDQGHEILFFQTPQPPTIVQRKGENIRLSRVSPASDDVAVLSQEGAVEILSFSGTSLAQEDITGSISAGVTPPSLGFLMSLRLIGDQLYACGMGGQVYVRAAPAKWRLISQTITTADPYERWFSNIDGLGPDYLLADGLAGLLYFFDGSTWQAVRTNTTVPIGEMAFVDRDDLYIAGTQSTLLRGSPNSGFRSLKLAERDLTLYAICRFRSRIFIGSDRGVFELHAPGQLSRVMVDLDANAFDVVSLQAVDDVLWCFGARVVYRFDDTHWHRIHALT